MLRSRHFISKQNDPTCHSVTAFLILNKHFETTKKSHSVLKCQPQTKYFVMFLPAGKPFFLSELTFSHCKFQFRWNHIVWWENISV